MRSEKFSIKKRFRSLGFAFEGLYSFFSSQHNALLHAIATVFALVMGIVFNLSRLEWLFIVFAIGLVWMAELFNTAIENLCDKICPEKDPQIKFIKDVAAAAVLSTAFLALITACIIFIPKLL